MNNTESDLFTGFQRFNAEKKLFDIDSRLLLAVSGGADSTVMAHLFHSAELNFSVAHCNFGLRGEESDAEEAFVEKLAEKFTVPFFSMKFDTLLYAEEKKMSVQAAARELRYRWFESLRVENNFSHIATAHHLNDSIETFFINLLRGSGAAGLRGIPVVNKNIIRPLIFARREQIINYAKQNAITYRTDSSNETDDYLRNRIRHHLIPVVESMMPDADKKFSLAFENISRLYDFAMSAAGEWKKKHVLYRGEQVHIPLSPLFVEQDPENFLSLLLYSSGITGTDTNAIMGHSNPGAVFPAGEFEILRDREHLVIRRRTDRHDVEVQVSHVPGKYEAGSFVVQLNVDNANKLSIQHGLMQVDYEKLHQPLTIRTWKNGDYFYPLGMTGKKKISDFFIDSKLNLFEKEKALLLLSGNDIVCILGHRIDDRFKITSTTKKILNIQLI